MSELEKGLLGLVVICVSAVVYVLKKKNGNGNGHSPSVAQLAQGVKDHIDASERRIMENINTTRHSVNNGLQTIQAGIIQEIKDSRK